MTRKKKNNNRQKKLSKTDIKKQEYCPRDLADLLNKEFLGLTDRIIYFGDKGVEDRHYIIYWSMKNGKTLWNTGNILVVDNEYATHYFKEAVQKKYDLIIPADDYYEAIIENKLYDARSELK